MIKFNHGGFMQVELCQEKVDVVLVRKKNKNIYLRFKDDLKLYATCNNFVTEKEVLRLILANKPKLEKMYQMAKKEQAQNAQFYYLGKPYTIVYNPNLKNTEIQGDCVFTPNEKELAKFYQQEYLRIFPAEVNRIKPYLPDIPEFTLKYRTMKSRWGVCNPTKKIVTLNTELLKKDIDLLDYVIIHELCHFYEANHSPKFWEHVSKYYPHYKEARKRLRG